MSFGGNSGFGGFGSTNTQNQGSAFGGFGASTNNNPSTGFGSSTNTGFGANTGNTGGGLFGSSNNNNTTGFGGSGGFGATNNTTSAFGAAKPAFGSSTTTGGGLFGNTANNATPSSSFGGFGSTTANNTQSGGFGSTSGGGLFGNTQNKPAFGGTTTGTTGGGVFGGGGAGTSTFGQTTGGFGQSGGFGQQNQQPVNQGTGSTPFSAHQEKDTGTSTTSHYQSITFMQPYAPFSFEELRLVDYNAGRRFGNSNGQAGAFGQSTGFGGFGQGASTTASTGFGANTTNNTGGGLFGANNQGSSLFGQNQQPQATTSTSFGSGGGGLFGQTKPAATGLFGSTPASSSAGTGSLFGTSNTQNNQTGGAFGGGFGTNTATNTGGGLFGGNNQNQQTQNKPAFGGFGANATSGGFGSTTGGFGQQQNSQPASTGLFGNSTNNNTTTSLFGGNQPNQQTNTSAFGGGFGVTNNQNQNQAQPSTTGGSLFGGSFGNNNQNQPKPGGLFGSTTPAGGSLFGGNNQQNNQAGTGLFGSNQNQQASGGLFGNKPATGGTSLFGGANNNSTTTGGGLFGNNNQGQNQNQGSNLFGSNNNNQNKSLFGSSTTGSNLFGGMGQNNNNTNSNPGLFGGSQQQNAGNSLFGNSQQNQQQSQPQSLTASLMQNPYGNDQLFAGLGTPTPSVGPLATPLSGAQKPAKRPQMIPAFKINPSASMRLITPQKRPNGYGFSYSTYGTPGSAQSFTPGRTGSLFGSGGVSRPLSKSLSTSNLRSPLSAEDSVLAPGAFTQNYRPYSSGNSIRRLKIDRSLRTDLFGEPPAERASKRVSFDGNTFHKNGNGDDRANGSASPGPNNALVRTETDGSESSPEEHGLARNQKEARTNGATTRPEMEQVRGNELAIVPEDEQVPASAPPTVKSLRKPQLDQEPGEYYMIPSLQDIRDMSRDQLKNVEPFIVGRVGIGRIEFSKVDLTAVDLEKIMGDTVKLNVRSATVYESGVNTPPEGKGLNVPSLITLENSWPRSSGGRLPVHERKGPRFEKHVDRLKRVSGTEFIDYSPETGEWSFRVQHFTTYGLDDDDETMMDPTELEHTLNTPTAKPPNSLAPVDPMQTIGEAMSPIDSDPDDTFDFKKNAKTIPGGFGQQSVLFEDNDQDMDVAHDEEANDDLANESALSDQFDVSHLMSPPETDDESNQVVGSFPPVELTAPKSILKAAPINGTPVRSTFQPNDDWAEQLQRTVSPKKQDRKALREQQNAFFEDGGVPSKPTLGRSSGGQAFNTTMDIMNSLWSQPKVARKGRGGQGFEWPYEKKTNGDLDTSNMDSADQSFHSSVKPRWTSDGTLIYALAGNAPKLGDGVLVNAKASLVGEGKDVRFAHVQAPQDTYNAALSLQLDSEATKIKADRDGIPAARTNGDILTFTDISDSITDDVVTTQRERNLWRLAAILFDPVEVSCHDFVQGVPESNMAQFERQIRREAVLDFWRDLTKPKAMTAFRDAVDAEAKALACLSCGDIEGACTTLIQSKNFHLATLVSQLRSNTKAKEVMRKQIEAWRTQNVTSEIPVAIRALYELIAGNSAVSEGKAGPSEDRAPTFGISDRFNLDWQQAVGLRLWYGNEDIGAAVQSYLEDVSVGKEKVKPTPGSTLEGVEPSETERQDGLIVLLRLYAAQTSSKTSNISTDELFSPVSLTGNPFNARLSWQFATLLSAKSMLPAAALTDFALDNLSTSLAAQLESQSTASAILTATTVLQHLSTSSLRSSAIRSLLSRRAALLTPTTHPFAIEPTDDASLQHLLRTHIPASWLHSARALHAAATGDHNAQAAHLLLAGAKDEAHGVLCAHVGPAAVISRDFDALRELLGQFLPPSSTAFSPASVPGVASWKTGGQVYFDYVHLLDLAGPRADEKHKAAVLARLAAALPSVKLPAVHRQAPGGKTEGAAGPRARLVGAPQGLEQRVAVAEMSRVVLAECRALGLGGEDEDEGPLGKRRLARLPVPDDGFVRQGGKLWDLYGRALQVR